MSQEYEDLRPLMFSIAYRMLGSVADAEDVVQEAFLRAHRAASGGEEIESPKAYLSTVTTRLAIDHLRSARVRRETYVGTWLPEPMLTADEDAVAAHAETADSLSLAFLVLLEQLSPVERAVFLLREVFGYGYDEIASVVDRSQDNCRQLAVRARRRIAEGTPRFEASRQRRQELADLFFGAAGRGDTEGLVALLAADAVAYGDGGGKAPAFPEPVHGAERVARLLLGLRDQDRIPFASRRRVDVNGQPGAVFLDEGGAAVFVVSLDIAEGQVQAVRAIANPDKLARLMRSSRA